ncbi:MAG: peptidylprolyl isomerase [Gemmatimonadales bacterium]
MRRLSAAAGVCPDAPSAKFAVRCPGLMMALAAGMLVACDEPLSRDEVVRAGDHTLTVEALAQILTQRDNLPLTRDFVERFAHRWMEYSLFAQEVGRGDSLLDSATVLEANWPDMYQSLTYTHHQKLVEERAQPDSAAIDSAFEAGDMRAVFHILVKKEEGMTPGEFARARSRAERLRTRLLAGDAWEVLNREYNDDLAARERGGSVGIVSRGETVSGFDSAAFALAPGEISDVVETAFGFHIIRRPALGEVYDSFRRAVESRMISRLDSAYLVELEERWDVRLDDGAAPLAREVVHAPLHFLESRKVLGRSDAGKFTVADLIRWLEALPLEIHQQALGATDEQLEDFLRSLIRNDALAIEAQRAGVRVLEDDFRFYRQQYAARLTRLRDLLGIDSARARTESREELTQMLKEGVDQYTARIAREQRDVVVVPPFLAGILRERNRWEVSPSGVDRVVARAQAILTERAAASDTVEGP